MKFKCIISKDDDVKVGRIIEGEKDSYGGFIVLGEDLILDEIHNLKKGDDIPIVGGLWVWEQVADESPISLLMKQLGVEEGEEFDVVYGSNKNVKKINYNPYMFKNDKLYDSCRDESGVVSSLIYGKYRVQKLPQKSEEELKLEEIQKTIDELQKQKDELETVIKRK